MTKTRMERDEDECRVESDVDEWSGEKSERQERERRDLFSQEDLSLRICQSGDGAEEKIPT